MAFKLLHLYCLRAHSFQTIIFVVLENSERSSHYICSAWEPMAFITRPVLKHVPRSRTYVQVPGWSNHGFACRFSQLSATDVSARTTMKGAAKCDKHGESHNSANQWFLNVYRALGFTREPVCFSVDFAWQCASAHCFSCRCYCGLRFDTLNVSFLKVDFCRQCRSMGWLSWWHRSRFRDGVDYSNDSWSQISKPAEFKHISKRR